MQAEIKTDSGNCSILQQREPLLKPSKCISEICITTDNAITLLLMRKDLNTFRKEKCLYENIITMVMRQLQVVNIFPTLKQHQFEVLSCVLMFDDHILILYRSVNLVLLSYQALPLCKNGE